VLNRSTLVPLLFLVACGTNDPATSGSPSGTSGGSQANSTGGTAANSSGGSHAGTAPSSGGKPASTGGGAGTNTAGDTGMPPGDAGTSSAGAPAEPSGDYWKPKAGLTWQWQLSEDVGTPLDVDVYDIDWEADKAIVDKLHAAGIKVICYVSVGSFEDFRPDAKDFPAAVIGNDYEGWPGEKYVDIRADALRAVMSARFDLCESKGFDAIEPDNMDVFELGSDSGFPLTEKDGVAYANWLATSAHSRGLGIGQKNASSITSSIAASYDWALTESCYSDGDWCGDVKAYATADKPVFMCEYEAKSFNAACSAWKPKSYSPILKGLDLDSPVTFCP
jgi:Glycoside-hydrolase family GH114